MVCTVCRPSPDGRLRRAGFLALTLSVLACALGGASGCSRREASAQRAARTDVLPAPILDLPGQPSALAYFRSPAQLGHQWLDALRTRLGPQDELVTLFERCWQTPAGPGLGAWQGTTVFAVYAPTAEQSTPQFYLRVQGGDPAQLDPWVAQVLGSVPTGERALGAGRFQLTPGPAGQSWCHGRLQGDWVLTSDSRLLGVESNLRATLAPVLRECWTGCGDGPHEAFLALDVATLRGDKRIDRRQLKPLGLDRIDVVAMAFRQADGRCLDRIFLHSPAPHRGLLGLCGSETITEAVLAEVAEESISFGIASLDLAGLWDQLQASVGAEFGAQAARMEEQMGFWIRQDLLASLGTQWVTNVFPHVGSPQGMATVLRVPVADAQRLRTVLDRMLAQVGPAALQDGPQGFQLLALPVPLAGGGEPPVLAVGDGNAWYLASSAEAFRTWRSDLVHRGGHAAPKEIFQRYARRATWLGWTSRQALQRSLGALAQLPAHLEAAGPLARLASAGLPLASLLRSFDRFAGDLLTVAIPTPKGVLLELESDCGLLPVVLAAAAGAVRARSDGEDLRHLVEIERTITGAQQRFQVLNGRFASNLWELQDAHLIESELARGICEDGTLYRVTTRESEWRLEFRRDRDRHVFQIDGDGTLRMVAPRP